MHRATNNTVEGKNRGRPFGNVSLPAIALSVTGAALLATRFYLVRELLALLTALLILFVVGTASCLLIVVVHESGRWSVRKFNEAKKAKVLSLGGLAAN